MNRHGLPTALDDSAAALLLRAQTAPQRTAFVFQNESWSYRRHVDEAQRTAAAMRAQGIRAGDRIALHVTNVPELISAYYAYFLSGALAVPLNLRLKAADLQPLLDRLRPSLYLGRDEIYPHVAAAAPDVLAPGVRFLARPTGRP